MADFTAKGYQGFGSFHSDNVEELIRAPADGYVPPPRPVALHFDAAAPPPAFGLPLRQHFLLDWSWTFLNHGAFGSPVRPSVQEARAWADYAERQPLRFIDRELFPHMCASIRAVAALVRAPPTSIALVPNATYALTSVIRSVCSRLPPGSCAFMLDIGYGSVKKMCLVALEGRDGVRVEVGAVAFPLSTPEALVAQVVAMLPGDVGLVILDHVTSNSGLVLPVELLVPAIRAARPAALLLIDGAHGLGAFDLNLEALGADFYVANAHKWLCSSRGLGLLYASPVHVASGMLRGAAISHGSGGGFTSEFIWDGARDYSPALALPGLLEWWAWAGGLPAGRAYCRDLLASSVALLVREWGSSTQSPMTFYSHMACVQLPPACLPPGAATLRVGGGDGAASDSYAYACTSTHGKMLQDALHYGFKVECPVKTLRGPQEDAKDMRSYVRISVNVYNTLADYEALAQAVLRIRWARGGEGEVKLHALPEGQDSLTP